MKSNRKFIYLFLIVALLLAAKFLFFPSNEDQAPAAAPGTQKKAANNVEGYIVKASVINNRLEVTGSIIANEMVELRPEISGKVLSVSIKEGQPVKQGQLLVKLIDEDLKAQLKKVNAQIKLSSERLNRQKELLDIQGVSKEEYDMALNEVQSLSADADVLQVQLNRTEIRAPFSGVIGLKNVSTGSYINPQNVVASIQQVNPVKIDFAIPERYSQILKLNTKIDFSVEGSDEKYSGNIYAMEPVIDAGTRSLKVRALAENPNNKITPGAFARVEILMDQINNAMVVPTQSIIPVLKGQQVFVSRAGIAKAVQVKIGVREEKTVQITEGLQSGDTVITTGVMAVREGAGLKFMHVE